MSDNVLRDRGLALEEIFFHGEDAKLIARLKEERHHARLRQEMEALIGLDDPAIVYHMLDVGITSSTFSALAVVPLVAVAWASGRVEPRERAAVLAGAAAAGVNEGTDAYALLSAWLARRPDEALLQAWEAYAKTLVGGMTPKAAEELRARVLGRARSVAEAAGGFLGIGGRILPPESAMLERLDRSLQPLELK